MRHLLQEPVGDVSTASRRRRVGLGALVLATGAASAVCGLIPVTDSLASGPPITGQTIEKYVFSPNYATDTTIWALTRYNTSTPCNGNDLQPAPPCDNLYESTDGGTKWSWVPGPAGADVGDVVLPSAYPTDPNVFVLAINTTTDASEVYRSSDGGSTWQSIDDNPGSGIPMLAQPGQSAGHDHIVIPLPDVNGFQTYDEATGHVTPGPTVPADIITVNSPVWADASTFFAIGYTPQERAESFASAEVSADSFLVTSFALPPIPTVPPLVDPLPAPAEVLKCTLTSCTDFATVPQGGTQLAVSPDYSTDHTFAVWGPEGTTFAITQDGGSSFSTVSGLPGGDPVVSAIWGLTFRSDGRTGPRVSVSTATFTSQQFSWVSDVDFSGGSYTTTSHDTTSFRIIHPLEAAPDDNLWSGALSGPGPECSSNGGSTWAVHC